MAGRDFPLKQRVFSTFKNSKEKKFNMSSFILNEI